MTIQAELGNTVIMITHDVDEAVLLSDRIVMMTNGPAATIGDILDIDLPRPRDRLELAEDPTFVHLRQQVLAFLYAKHGAKESTTDDIESAPEQREQAQTPQLEAIAGRESETPKPDGSNTEAA